VRYQWHRLYALLDTGSDVTIAGRDVEDRCEWTLESGDIAPIKTASEEELIIDGIAKVPIRAGGKTVDTEVLVTPDITGLILGVDWMEQQGPVTWDFQNSRIRFGNGEWLALQKEKQWRGVRRVCSWYTMSRDSPTMKRIVRRIKCDQMHEKDRTDDPYEDPAQSGKCGTSKEKQANFCRVEAVDENVDSEYTEIYRKNLAIKRGLSALKAVKMMTQTKGDVFGLAGGDLPNRRSMRTNRENV